jgi:pyocin large subunit-like protein
MVLRPPERAAGAHPEIGFRSPQHLLDHFDRHGAEFRASGPSEYLAIAQALRDAPVGGPILEAVRKDGVITRFDRSSGTFIAFDRDLVIRTCFKPHDGLSYFRRQALRDAAGR